MYIIHSEKSIKHQSKHRSLSEQKSTLQPYEIKNGIRQVNEEFIKAYGSEKHPDKEVQDFYKKRQ